MTAHLVTYHACIRYLERVLGLPVDEWLVGTGHLSEFDRALLCCERAGLPVDAVKQSVLCKPVLYACMAGFVNCVVRCDNLAYVIREGRVATILTDRMRDKRIGLLDKVKTTDRSSMRREILKHQRRLKGKNKSRDRRLAEVD
jgi:hypothetical protein